MRICIPTVNETGLHGRLSTHFGRAPHYTLVESSNGALAVIPNIRAQHDHGRCDAAQDFEELGIGAVICRGLGRNALAGLRRHGVTVFVTDADTVQEAMEAFHGGRLVAAELDGACHGDGHS